MVSKQSHKHTFFNIKDVIIRHSIIGLMAVFFGIAGKNTATTADVWRNVFSTFILITVIWNGNIVLSAITDKGLSWETQLKRKLIQHAVIAVLWPILVNYGFNLFIYPFIHGHPCKLNSGENISYLIISVALTLLVNSVFVASAFFKFWRDTISEKEAVKREIVLAEFATLKNQINPHFLFNSLNTLTSLIEEQPALASEFVQKMASVYRYVLTQRDKETAPLHDELKFVESYIYLNKIRFGENFNTHIQVDEIHQNKQVVTLALQMLIENALKHNVISEQRKLELHILVEGDFLVVKNKIQRKATSADSNGIGLNNIVHRYSFVTDKPVQIEDNGIEFCVRLPLL